MSTQGSAGNVIAAIANFIIPGLGHLVQGRLLAAIVFFVFISVCYFFWWAVFPLVVGIICHLWCIIDAARYRDNQ